MMSRNKFRLSLIVPTMCAVEDSILLESFHDSNISEKIFVQFVFLMNSRREFRTSDYKVDENYAIVTVGNDRHFGSCEENIYRIQDFIYLIEDVVLCIGDNDIIDWTELASALDVFNTNRIDAMGCNVLHCQQLADGNYSKALAIEPLPDVTLSNRVMSGLLSGSVIDGKLAFSAILANYGPINWAAYIGTHLFSREVFAAIINRKFYENVYSFVYEQAAFFHENDSKYAFYNKPIISRIADEYIRINNNTYSPGWLEDHRTVQGGSPIFYVSNLALLSQLNDKYLFNNIAYSLCYTHLPNSNGEITVARMSFLMNVFIWSSSVLQYKILGRSKYFPDHAASGSIQEIIYDAQYFDIFTRNMPASIKTVFGDAFVRNILCARSVLDSYVKDFRRADFQLRLALSEIEAAAQNFQNEKLIAANDLAYRELAMNLANRQMKGGLSS